ncbi:MAG: hypothetical protein GJ676_07670 [Rhodobacteraceae bacterium]|nr:hypothetical protein [Paracoccaceae bacterium]
MGALVGALTLFGCEETALVLLTAPGAAVVAPVGGALVLADGAKIRQPVMVKSAAGAVLTPDFAGAPKAKFTVSESTVVCTGTHRLNQPTVVIDPAAAGGYSTYYKVNLACNKGLKGNAFVSIYPARGDVNPIFQFEVGPKNVPLRQSGGPGNYILGQVTYSCFNEFSTRQNPVAPFGTKCQQDAYGVVAQGAANQGGNAFTVWVFPSG